MPHVYDKIIKVGGIFPHHDQVPLYSYKHVYVDFFLHMYFDYTSMPLCFYGVGKGQSHERYEDHKDPIATLSPP